MRPSPVPHGRTARRLDWVHLPPLVRREVESRLGASVVDAESQDAGYTPGFASVLTTDDGARHFVKAASVVAQRAFADAYREEARVLAGLPDDAPAPPLLWSVDVDDWFVLATEHVDARAPQRPWRHEEVVRCLDALAAAVPALTPAPAWLRLSSAEEEMATWPAYWDHLGHLPRQPEAAALAASYAQATAGGTLVHGDVRDDNLLLAADGRTLLCDWNWPFVGAPWLDSLVLLIGPRGDGVDVEALIAASPLLAAAEPEAVDAFLALVTGYFLLSARQPVPPTSPHLRAAQQWQGEVCLEWLGERRGWI